MHKIFKNFLKNHNSRSHDSKNNSGINSKNRNVDYTDDVSISQKNEQKNQRENDKCFECEGYGHIYLLNVSTHKRSKMAKLRH